MKNLPLHMTQIAAQTKIEVANKSSTSADKSFAAEPNSSFQAMLTKQVKAQKEVSRQESTSQQLAKTKANLHSNADPKETEVKVEFMAGNPASISNITEGKQVADKKINDKNMVENIELIDSPSGEPIELTALIKSKLTSTEEDLDQGHDTEGSNKIDAFPIDFAPSTLVPSVIVPAMKAITIPVAQDISLTSSTKTTISEGESQKQQNLDLMLGNALSQAKNIQLNDVRGKNINAQDNSSQGGLLKINDNSASDKTDWSDVMQQSTAKQAVSSEQAMGLNMPKDLVSKDVDTKNTAIKESVIPASNLPPMQTSATLPVQQSGSANTINTYLGKTGWDQAISQKVVWMVGASEQSATLTLNPPDLGPLQVVINVNNSMVDTTFISDNAEVRQALQDGMSNLREKMNESGIQLGQANISSGGQPKQEFQQATQNRLISQPSSSSLVLPEAKVTVVNNKIRSGSGLVDTFV